jgi:hypothetical protein
MKQLFAVIAGALFAFALPSDAQPVEANAVQSPTSTAPAKPSPSEPHALISVDFPGGSVAQLMSMLSRSGGAPFNVIGDKADLATELPAFSVRNAEPAALAPALQRFLFPHGLTLQSALPGDSTVYTLTKIAVQREGLDVAMFKSFQLAPYLQNQSIDNIVAAIRQAWQLNPSHKADALQLKYHPPTTILLVSGPPEAVSIAAQVISSLKPATTATPTSDQKGASPSPIAEKG